MSNDLFQRLYERNLAVIPLIKGEKPPAISGWSRFSKELPTQEEIDQWSKRDCGIGLVCGAASKVIAIDVDTDDEDILRVCPPSPLRKKGKKGETRFFRYSDEVKLTHLTVLDVLSNGSYTVLPPSIHPETKKPYVWLTPDTLDNFDVSDLPTISQKEIDELDRFIKKKMGIKESAKAEVTPSNGERCAHGSHTKLSEMAVAGIYDGESISDIVSKLLTYDEKINPEISYFVCPSRKEWKQRKSRELNAYEFVLDVAKNKINKGEVDSIGQQDGITIDLHDEEEREIDLDERPKRSFMKMPPMPGLGRAIFEDMMANSPIPRKSFCFMSTLNVFSMLINNNANINGVYANLYMYSVAPSAYGKDFPMSRGIEILNHYGRNELLGSSSPTSETLILNTFKTKRANCIIVNEAESLLKRMLNDRSNFGVRECLTALFDAPGKSYVPKQTMGGKNGEAETFGDVFSPYQNLYLSSTEKAFSNYSGIDLFDTGLFSRVLFFFEDKYKRKAKGALSRPIEPLSDYIKEQISIMTKDNIRVKMDSINTSGAIPSARVLISDEAKNLIEQFAEDMEVEAEKYKDEKFFGLIARKPIFFIKFVLLAHAMNNHADYKTVPVEGRSVKWAKEAIDVIMNNMMINLERKVFTSAMDKKMKEILKYIERKNDKREIVLKEKVKSRFSGHGIGAKEAGELIALMIQSNMIKDTKTMGLFGNRRPN